MDIHITISSSAFSSNYGKTIRYIYKTLITTITSLIIATRLTSTPDTCYFRNESKIDRARSSAQGVTIKNILIAADNNNYFVCPLDESL